MIQEVVEQIENTVRDVMNSNLHTNMPAEIVGMDLGKGLVDLKPVGSYYMNGLEMEYPVISSVPLVLNASGEASFVSPIHVGDTVLMACAEQSLSTWLTGTSKHQMDERYELQNAMAIPGLQKEAVQAQEEANAEEAYILTNGSTKCKIKADGVQIECSGVTINVTDGAVSISGAEKVSIGSNAAINGNLSINGDLSVSGNYPGRSS